MEVSICRDELCSWNTLWKWTWFTRDLWISEHWENTKRALDPLFVFLPKMSVKSILDCSCGLGFKTITFAKEGYDVEGSDASHVAIKYAPQLAKEHGLSIRFFHSFFKDLPEKAHRIYDCVYSDYFDELGSYEELRESARGIYSVLKNGGVFIFCSCSPKWAKSKLNELIERVWKDHEKFEINPPVKRENLEVTHIAIAEKTSEGILENNIFLIREKELMWAEIAPIMNPRIKWTYWDYVKILKDVGFRRIEYVEKVKSEIFVIAIK